MTRETSVMPRDIGEIGAWTLETDVVVVGYGCAGASAALEAAVAGADVVVVERAGGAGGASAIAGGELYLGGGTPIQKACGFDDNAEEMFKFLIEALGPHADQGKVALYCENSLDHFHWLVDCGVPFKPSMWTEPTWVPPTDDGLMWMGENSYPFDELARPAPRGHRPKTGDFGGWLLMDRLSKAVGDTGARTQPDTFVDGLIVETDGRVVGVFARQYGKEVTVRARRGVVLATGGFVYNDDMLAQHAPTLLGHTKIGTDADDGRGIRMAQAVGAAVKRMDSGQAGIMVAVPLLVRSLLVNAQGQRFINEDTYPGRVGQMALYHQNARAFMVLDEESFEAVPESERMGQRPSWACATVEELETEMGLPVRSLQSTVEVFNYHAAQGCDPLFHKRKKWLKPLTSPFGAIEVGARSTVNDSSGLVDLGTGFGVFTLGGLHTTTDGEVLDLNGEKIPGLFAAGRATSGIQAWGYISGTSLGEGTFFGRRAGRAVAKSC